MKKMFIKSLVMIDEDINNTAMQGEYSKRCVNSKKRVRM